MDSFVGDVLGSGRSPHEVDAASMAKSSRKRRGRSVEQHEQEADPRNQRKKKGGLQDPSGKNHGEFEISLGKRTGKKSASLRKQGNHRGARDPSVHRGVLPHHSHENSTYINEGLTE